MLQPESAGGVGGGGRAAGRGVTRRPSGHAAVLIYIGKIITKTKQYWQTREDGRNTTTTPETEQHIPPAKRKEE